MPITKRAVIQRIGYINMMLEERHSNSRIGLDNSYGGLHLAELDADGTIKKTIMSGMTKRELYDHLFMIEQVLWLVPV